MTPSETQTYRPPWATREPTAQADDLAQLVTLRGRKSFFVRLTPGGELHTHKGILRHDDLIGRPWGSRVTSHLGEVFYLMQPSLAEVLRQTRRTTQIMFPKDIGYVLLRLSVGPGQQVIEAGTGSGALTTALAFAVGPTGRVYSYERRPEMQELARRNLRRLGLDDRVTFKQRDIAEGFDETLADALFLDVPNPEDYLAQARAALKPGGFFGSLVPTTNQVSRLIAALERHGFGFIDVVEILLRYYKAVAERLRPTDRMVAHTGYLIFARPLEEWPAPLGGISEESAAPSDAFDTPEDPAEPLATEEA